MHIYAREQSVSYKYFGEPVKCLGRLQKCHPRHGPASLCFCCSRHGGGRGGFSAQQRGKNSPQHHTEHTPTPWASPPPRLRSGPLPSRARPSCSHPRSSAAQQLWACPSLWARWARDHSSRPEREKPPVQIPQPALLGGCSGLNVSVPPEIHTESGNLTPMGGHLEVMWCRFDHEGRAP